MNHVIAQNDEIFSIAWQLKELELSFCDFCHGKLARDNYGDNAIYFYDGWYDHYMRYLITCAITLWQRYYEIMENSEWQISYGEYKFVFDDNKIEFEGLV